MGALIKSLSILIGAIGLLLLAYWQFPVRPVPTVDPGPGEVVQEQVSRSTEVSQERVPQPEPDIIRPNLNPVKPSGSAVLDWGGRWHDDQNTTVEIRQNEAEIDVNIIGVSDGMQYQLTGTGTMIDQDETLNLDCRTLGMSVGQIPAKLTFINSNKAIFSLTFGELPIATELRR